MVENDVLYERELDFVVANAKKVSSVLKQKMVQILNMMEPNRTWRYSSGKAMEHDGPYNQIATARKEQLFLR